MKKKILVLLHTVLPAILFLAGCNGGASEKTIENVPQSNFINYTGSQMAAAPDGYYAFKDSFLYFITPDLSQHTIVCGKPECPHNTVTSSNLMDYLECNAFFPDPRLSYYNGNLYISCNDYTYTGGVRDVIYKVSPDGSRKERIFEGGQFIDGFSIHKGKLYIAETTYQSSSVTKSIKEVPLNKPDNIKVLFETEDYSEAGLNRLDCYEDTCYFYLFGTEGDTGVKYFGIDLKTGKVRTLYETPNFTSFLYLNAYGALIEDQDLLSDGDISSVSWKSRYYRIKPGEKELTELTGEDFDAINDMATVKNMDDKYIYFCTPSYGSLKDRTEQMLYIYTYSGDLAAKIPVSDFQDMLFFVLPGTKDKMFIQVMTTQSGIGGISYDYYYADKADFNGGTVSLKKFL